MWSELTSNSYFSSQNDMLSWWGRIRQLPSLSFFFFPALQMHKSYVFHSWRQVQNTYNPINYLHNRIQNQLTIHQKTLFFSPLKQCRYATRCTKDTLFKNEFYFATKTWSKAHFCKAFFPRISYLKETVWTQYSTANSWAGCLIVALNKWGRFPHFIWFLEENKCNFLTSLLLQLSRAKSNAS